MFSSCYSSRVGRGLRRAAVGCAGLIRWSGRGSLIRSSRHRVMEIIKWDNERGVISTAFDIEQVLSKLLLLMLLLLIML